MKIYSPNFGKVIISGPENWQFTKVQPGDPKPGSGVPPHGRAPLPTTIKPGTLGPPAEHLAPQSPKIKPDVAADMAAGMGHPHKDPELGFEKVSLVGDKPCPGGSVDLDVVVRNHGGNFGTANSSYFKIKVSSNTSPESASQIYSVAPYSTTHVNFNGYGVGTEFKVDSNGDRTKVIWLNIANPGTSAAQCQKYGSDTNQTYCDADQQNNYYPVKVYFEPASQCP